MDATLSDVHRFALIPRAEQWEDEALSAQIAQWEEQQMFSDFGY